MTNSFSLVDRAQGQGPPLLCRSTHRMAMLNCSLFFSYSQYGFPVSVGFPMSCAADSFSLTQLNQHLPALLLRAGVQDYSSQQTQTCWELQSKNIYMPPYLFPPWPHVAAAFYCVPHGYFCSHAECSFFPPFTFVALEHEVLWDGWMQLMAALCALLDLLWQSVAFPFHISRRNKHGAYLH